MKSLVLAFALVLGVVGSAAAADLPTRKEPPPAPIPAAWDWTGVYLGLNGGAGWANTSWSFPTPQFYATVAGQGFSSDPTGGMIGAHIGYNKQFGSLVLGVEASVDWADLSERQIGVVSPRFPGDAYKTRVTDLETLTGRLGYAAANWLFYGKGGLATTNLDFNVVSGPPVPDVSASKSFRLWGPTIGAGVEYMFTPHVVVGLEYDYSHFNRGGFATTGVCTVAAACGVAAVPVTLSGSSLNVQSVLARLSYKF